MKKNYFFALTSTLIWATTAALVKSLLADIPNMQALALGSACASLFLFLASMVNGSLKQTPASQTSLI